MAPPSYPTTARFLLLQALQRTQLSIKRSNLFSPATQPDATRTLISSQRSVLYPARIFVPRLYQNSAPVAGLPLLITVHGGAFIFNAPSADDPMARLLADACGCVVVAIDYRKVPLHPFPEGYEDVVESALALLSGNYDATGLPPIDVSRAVLMGASAGANLVLGAVQDPRLTGKLLGAVGVSPLVNFVPSEEEQLATRPDKGVKDFLEGQWDMFVALYLQTDKDPRDILRDVRLSPTFFEKRDHLPRNVYLVGVEHDMLCHEAKMMAEKLADEGEENNVQWILVKGQTHGFENFAKSEKEQEERRVKERDQMFQGVASWLKELWA